MKEPDDQPLLTHADTSQRFLFEQADIRGETVHLDRAYRDVLAIHQYAPGVSRLLGEFLAAAVLLSTNLKFEGKLILQVHSQGQVPLLMVECDHNLQIRGIARGAEQATANSNEQLLTQGQLAITVDPRDGQRYQGIVSLDEHSLARSLVDYFAQSEQLKTRIWLAADGAQAAGLLLQQLPQQIATEEAERDEHWDRACSLAATVTDTEILGLDAACLLYRLYHEDPVRLFAPAAVTFRCSCSRERTYNALLSLGCEQIQELLQDVETITMDCEFCNQQYHFGRPDLADVLGPGQSKTLH